MKAPSPLLGFNNNVRHKGRVFHIQTEDSGIRHPHIITHLFADGGRILKTTKTSYAEHLGHERLAETVRAMMQDQHKAMFIALRDGQFDYLFEEGGGGPQSVRPQSVKGGSKPVAEAAGPERAAVDGGVAPKSSAVDGGVAPKPPAIDEGLAPKPPAIDEGLAPKPPAQPTLPALPPLPALSPVVVAPPIPPLAHKVAVTRPVAHFAPTEPAQRAVVSPVAPSALLAEPLDGASAPPSRQRAAQRPTLDVDPGAIHGIASTESSIDLDLDALERAAAEAQTPFFQQIQDLPPPPAAVLGSKRASTGGYSVRSPMPPPPGGHHRAHDDGGSRVQNPDGGSRPQAPGHDGAPRPRMPAPVPSPGRYAPSRPASIFATTRPQDGASIFGEDLISEKSLDEVILSYLAEDLDGPAEKK